MAEKKDEIIEKIAINLFRLENNEDFYDYQISDYERDKYIRAAKVAYETIMDDGSLIPALKALIKAYEDETP